MPNKPTKEELRKQAEEAVNAENAKPVAVEEETAVIEEPATGRDALLVRVRDRYPDREFADDDDEALYGGLEEYARERDAEMEEYRDNERKLSDMMTRDPRSANLLLALRDGKSLAVELVKRFGSELKDAIDNPELLDQMAEAEKEYIERVQRGAELEEEYKTNLAESLKLIDEWQSERGLSDDEEAAVTDYLHTLTNNVVVGRFTREMLDMAYNALHHDADVAAAESVGEVRGRNARINADAMRAAQGDGIPVLGGAGAGTERPQTKRNPLFALADEAR